MSKYDEKIPFASFFFLKSIGYEYNFYLCHCLPVTKNMRANIYWFGVLLLKP